MTFTFDNNTVSDLHKDARGFRPGETWWGIWQAASNDKKQQIWDLLCDELEDELRYEQEQKALALAAFQKRVVDTQLAGAGDMRTAIRWILEAEGFDEYDYQYGADRCAYHFGLAYDNPFKLDFVAVCRGKVNELD